MQEDGAQVERLSPKQARSAKDVKVNTALIATHLAASRLNQQDLARRWKVSPGTVNKVIHGKHPNSPLMYKLATALGLPVLDLYVNQKEAKS
jgi:DNA-binding XRE family transcriptional regulator